MDLLEPPSRSAGPRAPPGRDFYIEMFELPLFPLNTVLFPGMPLQIQIFEPRYKELLKYCLDNEEPFGVVLIREGAEALGPLPQPYTVGTTAHIREVEDLPLGRRLVTARGGERFKILSLRDERPYLIAEAESSPFNSLDQESLRSAGSQLRPGLEQYLQLLGEAGQSTIEPESLPSDPLAMAFLAASILNLPLVQKQNLLTEVEAHDLIAELGKLYRKEVALLGQLLALGLHEQKGRFPLN